MKRKLLMMLTTGLLAFSVSGCNQVIGGVMNTAMRTTEQRISDEISNRVAAAILGELGPRLIRAYTLGLMELLFYQGNYHTDLASYEVGQFTVWQSADAEYGQVMEKAFLRRLDNGQEWWRLESFARDDAGEEFHVILEGLFEEAEDGSRYVRRLRVKYPDSDTPEEVPITEEDAELWRVRGDRLTPESLEGMRQAEEELTVEAGTFQTVRYQAGSRGEEYTTIWWVAEGQVPGDMVKVRHEDHREREQATLELLLYGDDATESALGVF